MSERVFGILVGGGPAPGINGVIGAAATTALQSGARVVGIFDGFKHLMAGLGDGIGEHVRWLAPEDVDRIHLQGGSILRTARANPTKRPEDLANTVATLKLLGVNHLVTIGGDDTATSSIGVAEAADGLRVVHVPKTIDNDLPLPTGIPTFGYETAREHGAAVIERILEDCRTTGRWFVVVVMGRTAGHLALGSATAAGAHVVVVPEELPKGGGSVRLDDVVRVIEGSVVKRRAAGHPDGVAVVAEGLAEHIDPSDLSMLENVARDDHGHIRLADVPLGRVLCDALKASLGARGIAVAFYTKDVGYELRCAAPTAFDREYTRDLGVGAVRALLAGESGALITRQSGRCVPIPFEQLLDPRTGRAGVRRIDTDTDSYRHAVSLQTRVDAADLADADRLGAIAAAANLSPEKARKRYAPQL